MAITRNNYEAWFVDRLDGQMDAASCAAMDRFLAEHSDLAAEWASWSGQAWEAVRVSPVAEQRFPEPETLYQRPQSKRRIVAWWPAAALAAALATAWFVFGLNGGAVQDQPAASTPLANVDPASNGRQEGLQEDAGDGAHTNRAGNDPTPALAELSVTQERSESETPASQHANKAADAGTASQTGTRKTTPEPRSLNREGEGLATASMPSNDATGLAQRAAVLPMETVPASPLHAGSRFDDAAYAALAQARVLEVASYSVPDPARYPRVESFLDRLPPRLQRAGEKTMDAADGVAEAFTGDDPLIGRRENQQYIFEFEAGPLRITHRKSPKSDS